MLTLKKKEQENPLKISVCFKVEDKIDCFLRV